MARRQSHISQKGDAACHTVATYLVEQLPLVPQEEELVALGEEVRT